jgi:branched-subunit amino acid transport protein
MISEVKKHHGKTFVVLNWESSKEKLLVGYSRLLNSDSSILSSFSLFAIVLYFSFSYHQNAAKKRGWLFFLLNLVLDSIVWKDVIIRESTVLTIWKKKRFVKTVVTILVVTVIRMNSVQSNVE